MKLFATKKADQNVSVADPWTAVHFSAGLASGLVGMPFAWMIAAAIGYELVEHNIEQNGAVRRYLSQRHRRTR